MWAALIGIWGFWLPALSFAYEFDLNVSDELKHQLQSDLALAQEIQGFDQSPLHKQIFGPVDGQAYVRFFESRISSVGVSHCGNPSAVACVNAFQDPNKMLITPNYTKFEHPQIARLMVLFHEARHTEAQNFFWGHVNCPVPFTHPDGTAIQSIWTQADLSGEPACDVSAFGSYGSSVVLLNNISKFCINCTGKMKLDASLYASDQLNRIINPRAKKQLTEDIL